ncbi:hypothetical protein L208DRAFT_1380731 [Tricholoma matsutake]|nr:hypothetical protein L208DRAFT_1380731 [Tricholoma matsutake 945]
MAHALCPRAYIYEFDNDPKFLEKITSREVEITADQFPNFLYDEINAELPSEDEEWDVKYGLLHSSMCLWAYKYILLGNGFWMPLNKRRKSVVGKLNRLTQVMLETIGYTVAQVNFALSSCKEWGAEDSQFILEAFFHAILELFKDGEDEWVVETLDWWNEYDVFSSLNPIL